MKQNRAALSVIVGAAVIAAATIVPSAFAASGSLELTSAQRQEIKTATEQFKDIDTAIAAGYLPTDQCVSDPQLGGEGYHYVKPALMGDNIIDPKTPEILLYEAQPNGKRKLIGVEYLQFDNDQNLDTSDDRPYLYDHPFNGPMLGHAPGMPIHYDIHVYLYTDNPDGTLATWNQKVKCR